MRPHTYLPLLPESVRLLRLKPHEDRDAPLQCELFHYPLKDDRRGAHLYEALSYYWGAPDKSQKVFTDQGYLDITASLHAALARLRDPFFERIIWADAICINQKDTDEKGHQVQRMAEIYARANCVVVWLEEAAGDRQSDNESEDVSYRALQTIGLAASGSLTGRLRNKEDGEAVVKLLRRNWFRRIWVLQEVAASRNVLIMCHATEIDGYAFCQGLSVLDLSALDDITQTRVRSAAYLIKSAVLRPKRALHTNGGFSLRIRTLGELTDLYHTQNATDRRDKIYALLGMSTDAPSELVPDYRISWQSLFSRLLRSFLSEDASISTWDSQETALIQTKGRILGTIESVLIENPWASVQRVKVALPAGDGGYWTMQASAKPVQKGDIICLLQGATQPTIIRVYDDYCLIILMAVDAKSPIEYSNPPDAYLGVTRSEVNLLLVWDWQASHGNSGTESTLNDFLKGQAIDYAGSEEGFRLMEVGLLFLDMGQHTMAISRFYSVITGYENASKLGCANALLAMDHLIWAYRDRDEREDDKRIEAVQELANIARGSYDNAEEGHITRLASVFDTYAMEIFLRAQGDHVEITENILVAAASNNYCGKDMISILLNHGENTAITENVLKAAVANLKTGEDVVKLLFEKRGDQITITESILSAASRLKSTSMLKLLFAWEGCNVKLSCDVVASILRSNLIQLFERELRNILKHLLMRQNGQITITRELVDVIVNRLEPDLECDHRDKMYCIQYHNRRNWINGCCDLVLTSLLKWQGGQVIIAEDAVEAVKEGSNVIDRSLSDRCPWDY
ncbi:Heterokaryon incompatibility protein 6, OR allele [Colletotrichum siamense]|nr:Heterokaryon incompatibility protein 6, OR allele [Colletotrichum siamense]